MSELGKLFYTLDLEDKMSDKINQIKNVLSSLGDGKSIKVGSEEINSALANLNQLKNAINSLGTGAGGTIKIADGNISTAMSNIESIKTLLHSFDGGYSIKLDTATITNAIAQVGQLQATLEALKGRVNVSITGTQTADIQGRITNIAEMKAQVENALQGINISNLKVDTTSLKEKIKGEIWNIQLTTDQNNIQKIAQKVKNILGINKITVTVNPDLSKSATSTLKSKIEKELRNLSIPSIKVSVDKKALQSQLDAMRLTATVDIKVNQASAAQAVQSAVNQATNLSGQGGNNSVNIINRQNKLLTDQLGVRRAINSQMSTNTQLATLFGNAIGNVFGTYAVKNFLEALVQIGGEIQKQRLALGHILNDISHANELFAQMKQLAVKSPFGLLDLMKNARQLSAFGVEYNNLYDTMKRLSDVAAGLGIDFGRLSLAYGETLERTYLDGKILRQFAYMGLPILQKVAKYYTEINKLGDGSVITASQVRGMISDKLVSFEDVDAVIKKMTDVGGQFYNMQEVMAESVAGKWKNVKDAYDIFLSDMTEGNSEILKAPAEILIKLMKNYQDLIPVLKAVAIAMVGTKMGTLLNTTLLGKNAQAVKLAALEEKKLQAVELSRKGALSGLNKAEKYRLWNTRTITANDMKRMPILRNLSAEEKKRIALQQGLKISLKGVDKEAAKLLATEGLLSKREAAAIITGKGLSKTWAIMTASVRNFGRTLRVEAVGALASMATSLISMAPMLAVFGAAAWWTNHTQKAEEAKQAALDYKNAVKQARDDLRNETNNVSDEVFGLDPKQMTSGELSEEVKNMVEYIKNNVPDAKRILAGIFETDDNGKFKKDYETRFNELVDVVNNMDLYTKSGIDWTGIFRKSFENFKPLEAVQSFDARVRTLRDAIDLTMSKLTSEERDSMINNLKTKYKRRIANVLSINPEDVKDVTDDNIKTIAFMNSEMLNELINSNPMTKMYYSESNMFKQYKSQWNNVVESVVKTAKESFDKIKKSLPGFDLNNPQDLMQFKGELALSLKKNYPDADQDMVNMMINLGTDPNILAKLNAEKGTVDEVAAKILSEEVIKKNVFLYVSTVFDGNTNENPWADYDTILNRKPDDIATVGSKVEQAGKNYVSARKQLRKYVDEYKEYYKYAEKVNGKWKVKENFLAINVDDQYRQRVRDYVKNLQAVEDAVVNNKKVLDEAGVDAEALWEKEKDKTKNGGDGKKTTKTEDTALKQWKEQLDEIKKTWNEYQKWVKIVGEENAAKKMKDLNLLSGFSVEELADPDAYKKKVQSLINEVNKDKAKLKASVERQKLITSLNIEIAEIEFKGEEKAAQELAKNIQEEINTAMKQWDVYKAWFSATGNKQLSLDVAFNVKPIETEESKYFKDSLEDQLKAANKDGKLTSYLNKGGLLNFNMNEGSAEMWYDKFGLNALLPLWKKVKELMVSAGYEYSKGIAQSIENLQTSAEKMAVIEEKYRKLIDADKNNNGGKYVSQLEGQRDYEKLKIGNMYVDYMKRNLTLTENAAKDFADTIKDELFSIFKRGGITADKYAEEIKKVNDEMRKYTKSQRGSGMFGTKTFDEAFQSMYDKGYQQFSQGAEMEKDTLKMNDAITKFTGQSSEATGEMLQNAQGMQEAGQGMMGAASQASGAIGIVDMIIKGINQTVQALNKSVQYIDEMLESLGKDTGADTSWGQTKAYVSGFAESSQHAADSWENAKSGNFAGMVADQIGSVTSIITNFNKLHDAKLQAQINKMNLQNTTLDNIYGQLQTLLERTLGGIYNVSLDDASKKQLQNIVKNIREYDNTKDAKYSEETKKQAQKALDSNSYYDAQLANLMAQRDNLQNMYNAENDKKDTDYSSLEDLRSQLSEVEDQIAYFAEDMMNSLYGIDFKDWASQLGDSIIEAWAKGEDAAKAYEETVKELMNSVTKSVVSQQIIETALKPVLDQFKSKFIDANGKLDLTQISWLTGQLNDLNPQITEAVTMYLEQLKEMGVDLSDTESSTASSSIQGVTEETADILASYINGMRNDLSLQRLSVEAIFKALGSSEGARTLNAIGEAQVSQLENIAEYTLRTAVAVEALRNQFVEVTEGTKAININ